MNLHRSGNKPQWADVPFEQQNKYQRRAAKTRGIWTPGNEETVKGVAGTSLGLLELRKGTPLHTAVGLGLIVYGRWKDIKDGRRAEETETKSPLGEIVDITADKALTGAAVAVMIEQDIITKQEAGVLLAKNLANTGLSAIGKKRKREMHASFIGKVETAAEWVFMGTAVIEHLSEQANAPEWLQDGLGKTRDGTFKVMSTMALATTIGYARDALGSGPQEFTQPTLECELDSLHHNKNGKIEFYTSGLTG
jgi:phosphatidylglycerophosphate synthase